jgi:hypothetical protein
VDINTDHSSNLGSSTLLLPPLKNSTLKIDIKKIKKSWVKGQERFHEPSSVTSIKANVPVGYLNNFNTFAESINKSTSNLSKAIRFSKRKIFQTDLDDLPSPGSYDLSYYKSIMNQAKAPKETELREKLSPRKRYDRFKNKAYFKELDRGIADQSPGPWAYSPPDKAKFPSVRKSCETLFGKADRKLNFKKEDKESPSPTKYNVVYDFKGSAHVKGISFGKAEKKFSLF